VLGKSKLPPEFSVSRPMDDSILAAALFLVETEPDIPVVFVTKDTNLRIRADALQPLGDPAAMTEQVFGTVRALADADRTWLTQQK